MTAIGVIILVTQILPAVGYYPKEDSKFVNNFEPNVKEVVFNRYINDAKEKSDILNISDYKKGVLELENLSEDMLSEEAKTLVAKEASGVLGAIKVMPQALKNINWLELLLAFFYNLNHLRL
jgi:SulP family sulfate permease